MKVCEQCGGQGNHPRTYQGNPIRVLCGTCLGTGMCALGHESALTFAAMRERAIARAIREGWYEVAWEGEPGNAHKVVRPIRAEQPEPVRKSA